MKSNLKLLTLHVFLAVTLAACGGGGGGGGSVGMTDTSTTDTSTTDTSTTGGDDSMSETPGGGSFSVASGPGHTTEWQDNTLAEDLLDHWNHSQPLQTALGLSSVSASDVASRMNTIRNLIEAAEADSSGTATRFRNTHPANIEILGERDGITYGLWKSGPAGTLNIEFDWQFASNIDATTRAEVERAGKLWSRRFRDDFGTNTVTRGTTVRHDAALAGSSPVTATYQSSVTTDGMLVTVLYSATDPASSAAPWQARITASDFEPWHATLLISQRSLNDFQSIGNYRRTFVIVHELGHALGMVDFTNSWNVPSYERYVDRQNHTFTGPRAQRVNGGNPVPFQWTDGNRNSFPPGTPGTTVDYAHLGPCNSVSSYCSDQRQTYQPTELDVAFFDDIGYEAVGRVTASLPEVYGYGAWAEYSAWGAGVERILRYDDQGSDISAHDTLRASADAFGSPPSTDFSETHASTQGNLTWSGSLHGVDIGNTKLPPVFGNAELRVNPANLSGSAAFNNLTVVIDGASSSFRAPQLQYSIGVDGNSFSDASDRVMGSFYGPTHQEMAGILNDPASNVNLLAGFGGKR